MDKNNPSQNQSNTSPQNDSSGMFSSFPDLDDKQLTEFAMQVSEKCLEEVWRDEDDAYWESYL